MGRSTYLWRNSDASLLTEFKAKEGGETELRTKVLKFTSGRDEKVIILVNTSISKVSSIRTRGDSMHLTDSEHQ